MKYRQWSVASPDAALRSALEGAGLPPLLASILAARGIHSGDQAQQLLSPGGESLLSPLLMLGMDQAAARVRLALERGEQIAVYGDYDVDGITATCLLTEFLSGEGGAVLPYIPGRLEEGYGLNREAIASLARQGVTLIVTVDCGITAVDEVAFASQLGVDVVITDHHTCKGILPDAVAVVDPHQPGCPYPFKGLAGVGVALKLAMAVAGSERACKVWESSCDLAAIGTVADVMPMTGENRRIVSAGLARLNPSRRLGLARLISLSGQGDRPISSVSVGYTLAPRINASGRMGRAEAALELLMTGDPERAEELAQELCALNRERQTVEGEIFQQCVQRLGEAPQAEALVLAGRAWHQGVVGIVASRLAEKYARPCFMICLDQGMGGVRPSAGELWGARPGRRLYRPGGAHPRPDAGSSTGGGGASPGDRAALCSGGGWGSATGAAHRGGGIRPGPAGALWGWKPAARAGPQWSAYSLYGSGGPGPAPEAETGVPWHSIGRHLVFRRRRGAGPVPRLPGGRGFLSPDQRVSRLSLRAAPDHRPAPRPLQGTAGAGHL